jgi:hypothetical protein
MQHPIHFFVEGIRPRFRRGDRFVRFVMIYMFGLAGRWTMWPVFVPRLWVVLVVTSRFVRLVMVYMFGLAGLARTMWPVFVPRLWVVLVVTSRIRNELFFVYPQSACFSVR